MATELSQDAVLLFLRSSGGSAKNAELLLHFRAFIQDNAEQRRNRELFKKFVNSVATVRQTDGVSYVVLRKKFRGHGPVLPSSDTDRAAGGERHWHTYQQGGEAVSKTKTVLPAAGIVGNASVEAKKHVSSTPGTPGTPGRHSQSLFPALKPSTMCADAAPPQRTEAGSLHVITTGCPAATGLTDQRQQVTVKSGEDTTPKPSENLQITARRVRHRQSYKTAVSYDDDDDDNDEEEEVTIKLEHSSKPPWPPGAPLSYSGQPDSASLPCIINKPAPLSLPSSSSDRIVPTIQIQNIEMETEGAELGPGRASLPENADFSRCWPVEAEHCSTSPSRGKETGPLQQYPPSSDHYNESRHKSDPIHPSRLSSSHSSIFSPSTVTSFTSSEWLSAGSPGAGGWDRSLQRSEDLQARSGELWSLPEKQQALHKAPMAQSETVTHHANPLHRSTDQLFEGQASPVSLSPLHHSTEDLHNQVSSVRMMPWHLSTGDIYDCKDADSSEDSSPQQPPGVAKRLSSKLKNRMCRSLGADLDQFLQDEDSNRGGEGRVSGGAGNEAARLSRLYRISSSLSLRYALSSSSLSSCSTPPRCHSLSNLIDPVEGSEGVRGLPNTTSTHANPEGRSRESAVPLDPREHDWLVKGAAGAWTDIYSLFREDHSLLNRQDFISGFTVLHWIAKHGNHKVLNTLWYGAEKAGLTFNVNAKSKNGHTPLHIAAIHGNKNILRLLVTKFHADLQLRDTAGKKPWQYLNSNAPLEIFQLLGAPARVVKAGEDVRKVESSWEQQQQQQHRRRLRHHFSTASSGKRPLKHMGGTKVKRSTSLAAFLKHKSLHRFYGQQSDSHV
ncbi:uncharacterized protein sowahb isoform X2 [Gouania willdenowi]|uniref:uncharacterized protein sowahb isoform X2 n=1 Tax=Gouania willdenowi TaxID=441366 RepID=UPI0010551DDF|nr:uncharacterized protein LOC114473846 isoform X2 [Gouania willdenowi]